MFPTGDASDPNRYLRFVLNESNGDNQFLIRTPIFDTSSDMEFDNVFGLGIKTLGNSNDDFFISIRNGDKSYSICNSPVNYQIEILKVEEEVNLDSYIQNNLKVWIRIVNLDLETCNPNYNKTLRNGLIIANFIGYDFE